MIVSFLRRLFAGVPPNVMSVVYALTGAAFAVLANALQALSVGQVWNTHAVLMALAGAVSAVIVSRIIPSITLAPAETPKAN